MIRLALFLLIPVILMAQVNVESLRENNGKTFSLTIPLSVEMRKGNDDLVSFSGSPRIDFQKDNAHVFVVTNVAFEEEGGERVVHEGYMHTRFVYTVTDYITPELFYQEEYNESIELDRRNLLGLGNRFTLHKKEHIELVVGIAVMYEIERYANGYGDVSLTRSTNYLKMNWGDEDFTVNSVVYYQPALRDFSNYRFLSSLQLEVPIKRYVSLALELNDRYDNKPVVPGVKQNDIHLVNSIIIKF